MPFFADFASALDNYPLDSVTLTITDVALQTGTAGSVNINEVWKFKVNVTNNGHVNMSQVQLHIEGKNGATVGTAAIGPWFNLISFGSLTVNAGGSQKTGFLYFKAPAVAKPAGTALVGAHVNNWKANLDHLLDTTHTGHANPPEGGYANQVFP